MRDPSKPNASEMISKNNRGDLSHHVATSEEN